MDQMVEWRGKEMEEEEEERVEVRFTQGQDIEIGSNEIGFKGSWYGATVLHSSNTPSRSASKITKKVYVQYQTLLKDEEGSNALTEYVDISRVRPQPPPEEDNGYFEEDEEIEAFYNDGWWEGTIMQVLENQKYKVFFRNTYEEIEFHQSEIRRQRKWINGKWVFAEKVEEVPVPVPVPIPITLTPKNQSRIRSPRATQSSQARRKLSKVENQSTPKKASSIPYAVSSSKKKKMQSSFNSDTKFSRPCKKLKTAEGMKTLLSLVACSMTEVDGRNDFTTSTTKGKRSSVPRKRKTFRGLAAIFLDLSSEEFNKAHPKPLDSYHKKPKHALEGNGSGDHSSVQDCSSQLPLNTIEIPQYKLVDLPKTKVLVQTTTKDSGTKAAVKGRKHKGAQGRSQAPAAHTQTHTIDPEPKIPSKETTIVVYREDTSKETEKDGASSEISDLPTIVVYREDTSKETEKDGVSSEISDLHQPLSMLFRESYSKRRVQRQKKFKVRPRKQERKALCGNNMKLQIMEKGSNQTTTKDSSTETAVNGGKHKSVRGKSQAPAAQTQTQTIGLELTTPSKETAIVVHRGDTLKETEMDGASSDIRDMDQPLSMLLQESCLPPIIGEKGISSDNQPTVQSVEAINWKDAATRGLDEGASNESKSKSKSKSK